MSNWQTKPEKECPRCKGVLSWKIVYGDFGSPKVNGLCVKCNIVLFDREAPEVSRGRALELGEMAGVGATDDRITSLPGHVQLGILRQRHYG